MPEAGATTTPVLRQRAHALCQLVLAEPRLQPSHRARVAAVQAAVADAQAGRLGAALCTPLCDLALSLLTDLPFRLAKETVTLLHTAAASADATARAGLLESAAPTGFFVRALQHANREVRSTSLDLLRMLSPSLAVVPASSLPEVLRGCALSRLCELLVQPRQALAAAETLRGFSSKSATAAACREAGLATDLQALPPSARQGGVGAAVTEVLLRMGILGGRSAVGELLRPLVHDEGGEEAPPFADAAMLWPDGRRLHLHRCLLAARGPAWSRLVEDGDASGSAADGADGADDAALGDDASLGLRADLTTEAGGGNGGGVRWCALHEHAASALEPQACAVLYELLVCGCAELPPTKVLPLRSLGRAAALLGLRELLLSPPCDAAGVPSLCSTLATLVPPSSSPPPSSRGGGAKGGCVGGGGGRGDSSCGGVGERSSDIEFVLRDGRLRAHRCLLHCASEYFARMLAWGRLSSLDAPSLGTGVRRQAHHPATRHHPTAGDDVYARQQAARASVTVAGTHCAAFRALLRYLYSGSVNTSPRHAAAAAAAAPPPPPPRRDHRERDRDRDARAAAEEGACATAAEEPAAETEAGGWLGLATSAAPEGCCVGGCGGSGGGAAERHGHTRSPAQQVVAPLSATDAFELLALAQRYLLPRLASEARARMTAALTAAEVTPLLWRAQQECEAEALEAVFVWAVKHYEAVAAQLELWLGSPHLAAAPSEVRELGAESLAGLHEQLRAAMLKSKYGL